jgi:hypothetical protein
MDGPSLRRTTTVRPIKRASVANTHPPHEVGDVPGQFTVLFRYILHTEPHRAVNGIEEYTRDNSATLRAAIQRMLGLLYLIADVLRYVV